VQATVVELADEVVCVTTPDVLALRGLRRAISQWEGLGVRKETDVRVLVNRVSRQTTVSAETVRQLTRAPVLSAGLPSMFRRLEPALNARDPRVLREDAWWRTLRAIGHEIGLVRSAEDERLPRAAAELIQQDGRRRRKGGRGRDSGATTLDTVGTLPILLIVVVMMWQAGIYGMSLVWAGRAGSAAARAASVHQDPRLAAVKSVPDSLGRDLTVVTDPYGSKVTVSLRVPLFAPGVGQMPVDVTVERAVVMEP
jgi:pilus assembly protein CpaE